uniref:Uncharacterized protein n=1 Tax=Glossina pallidipes TaxID=7398 RepID=A0A1A9ZPG9_GLOPL
MPPCGIMGPQFLVLKVFVFLLQIVLLLLLSTHHHFLQRGRHRVLADTNVLSLLGTLSLSVYCGKLAEFLAFIIVCGCCCLYTSCCLMKAVAIASIAGSVATMCASTHNRVFMRSLILRRNSDEELFHIVEREMFMLKMI